MMSTQDTRKLNDLLANGAYGANNGHIFPGLPFTTTAGLPTTSAMTVDYSAALLGLGNPSLAPVMPQWEAVSRHSVSDLNLPDFSLLMGPGAPASGSPGSSILDSAPHTSTAIRGTGFGPIRGGVDLNNLDDGAFDEDDDKYGDDKVEAIRKRNREHARKSRLRKRMYMEQLQQAVDRLTQEQRHYEELLATRSAELQKVKMMEETNKRLQEQNRRLSQMVPDAAEASNARIQRAIVFLDSISACVDAEAIMALCEPEATFNCEGMPICHTVREFIDAVMNFHSSILSDYHYEKVSISSEGGRVTVVAYMNGIHDKAFGPVPPTNPPKQVHSLTVYTMHFSDDNKIKHIDKIFDVYSCNRQLGWPQPQDLEAHIEEVTALRVESPASSSN